MTGDPRLEAFVPRGYTAKRGVLKAFHKSKIGTEVGFI